MYNYFIKVNFTEGLSCHYKIMAYVYFIYMDYFIYLYKSICYLYGFIKMIYNLWNTGSASLEDIIIHFTLTEAE